MCDIRSWSRVREFRIAACNSRLQVSSMLARAGLSRERVTAMNVKILHTKSKLISEEQLRHLRLMPQHIVLETQSSQLLCGDSTRPRSTHHIMCQGVVDRYRHNILTLSLSPLQVDVKYWHLTSQQIHSWILWLWVSHLLDRMPHAGVYSSLRGINASCHLKHCHIIIQ